MESEEVFDALKKIGECTCPTNPGLDDVGKQFRCNTHGHLMIVEVEITTVEEATPSYLWTLRSLDEAKSIICYGV